MKTPQTPLHSGHGAKTTAREALGDRRLDGRTAIVTGGYVGIGLETTRVLAGAGATVIVPARSVDRARAALAGLARNEIEALDLADPARLPRSPRASRPRGARSTCSSTTPGSWPLR